MTLCSQTDVDLLRDTVVKNEVDTAKNERGQCSDMTVCPEAVARTNRASILTKSDMERLSATIYAHHGEKEDHALQKRRMPDSSDEVVDGINKYLHPAPLDLDCTHIVNQRRPGTHHGKGGRPRGTTRTATLSEVAIQVQTALVNAIADRFSGVVGTMVSAMVKLISSKRGKDEITHNGDEFMQSGIRMLEEAQSVTPTRGYYTIPGPFLAVCSTVMTATGTGVRLGKVMDKHAVCFWFETPGIAYCTCYGSTRFRVTFPSIHYERNYMQELPNESQCVHVSGMNEFISKLARSLNTSHGLCLWALTVVILDQSEMCPMQLSLAVPIVRTVKRNAGKPSLFVVIEKDMLTERYLYVPVRKVVRGTSFFVCCFCDNQGVRYCHHIAETSTEDRRQDENDVMKSPQPEKSVDSAKASRECGTLEDNGAAGMSFATSTEGPEPIGSHMTPSEEMASISRKPVSPVNCASSIAVDLMARKLVYGSGVFIATAPIRCLDIMCSGRRDPKTTTVQKGGVLMCTSGPCEFQYESGKCDTCMEFIEPEGRELHIVIDTMSTAATHAWLRTELTGVVLGNGTLTGRMRHYHGQVSSHRQHGLRPNGAPCRSIKSLRRLALIMLKLMCMNPPPQLFTCITCEFDGSSTRKRMDALCMDGINQGHLLRCKKPFKNICEPCKPKKPGVATGPRAIDTRPLDTLLRGTETVKILFRVVEGVKIQCNFKNVHFIAAVLRMVSPTVLPRFFCLASICGRSGTYYLDDLGNRSTLRAISDVVRALFDCDVVLKRLLEPLDTFLTSCSSDDIEALGGQPRAASSRGKRRKQARSVTVHISDALFSLRNVDCDVIGRCWSPGICEAPPHITNDVLRLAKMMLQGPVTQFLHKTDVGPAVWLAHFLTSESSQLLLHCIQPSGNAVLPDAPEGTLRKVQDIISRCVVLEAGLQSLIDLEGFSSHTALGVRKAFGVLFYRAADRVEEFYSFYDGGRGTTTATKYGRRWRSRDVAHLSTTMYSEYGRHQAITGNCYDIACTTGFFFPYRHQLRPLPFNDEEFNMSDEEEDAGYCSKNYLQRQKHYTPGCLTFVCSCAHPLVLGFKAIHRDEGPRVVLDTIVSRFAAPPRYLIYDFGCGLHNSARHSLWWALEDTTIVSDFFHYKNHSCSPAFEPGSHSKVAMVNTVAHEQRNRSIQALARTLRNSTQEFYLSLLAFQAMILNLQAKARSEATYYNRPGGVSAYDLEWCFFHCLKLQCQCCTMPSHSNVLPKSLPQTTNDFRSQNNNGSIN